MAFRLRMRAMSTLLACVVCALPQTARAESAPPDADLKKEPPVTLVAPAIGRPAFVRPGQTFTAILASTGGGIEEDAAPIRIDAALIAPRGGHRYPLEPGARAADGRLLLHVPTGTPAAVYDLSLRVGDDVFVAPHAVAVRASEPGELRVVFVDPLRLGSPEGAEHLAQFSAEINLTGADVVVLSGPFVSPLHPSPATAWADVISFIRACEAPVVAACGSEDWSTYTAHLGASPTGAAQVGPLLVLMLAAPPGVAAEADVATREWLDRTLAAAPSNGPVIVVSGAPPTAASSMMKERRGATLWYATEAISPTAWAAPANGLPADKAPSPQTIVAGPPGDRSSTGGYRVVDIGADGARGWDGASADRTAWIPAGSLSIVAAGADSDQARVVNRLAMTAPRLVARLRTAKRDEARPWVEGGTLVQLTDAIDTWECRVRFDAPSRTATRIRAGVGAPPAEPALSLARVTASTRPADSVGIVTAADADVSLEVRSSAATELTLNPVIRAAGREWSYAVLALDGGTPIDLTGFGRSHSFTVDPGVAVRLRLEPAFARLPPAAQASVQVFCFGSDTVRPLCLPPLESRAPRTETVAPPPSSAEPHDDLPARPPAEARRAVDQRSAGERRTHAPSADVDVNGRPLSEPGLRPVVRFGGARAAGG